MQPADSVLQAAASVLIVDWPSLDVPQTLAAAGYTVVVKGGSGPGQHAAYEVRDGEVVRRPPEPADIVYSHRLLDELPGIVAMAGEVGATAVRCQSGRAGGGARDPKGCWVPDEQSREARRIVEAAGLVYVADVYIADAVRHLEIRK